MANTPADIVNEAVQLIGGYNNQAPVTGTPPSFDGTTLGLAAGIIYSDTVAAVGRQHGYDFSRNQAALGATGNSPPVPWSQEYLYPTNGIQVREILPMTPDPYNPAHINFVVGNTTVGGIPKKVIWCNVSGAIAIFTGQPPESLWDAMFTQAVIRLLASQLAMAVAGRPDTAGRNLQDAAAFGQIGKTRDD